MGSLLNEDCDTEGWGGAWKCLPTGGGGVHGVTRIYRIELGAAAQMYRGRGWVLETLTKKTRT